MSLFDDYFAIHLFRSVLLVGFCVGAGTVGIIYGIIYLCHHVTIGWTP